MIICKITSIFFFLVDRVYSSSASLTSSRPRGAFRIRGMEMKTFYISWEVGFEAVKHRE
jgi:hypothetical protein